ncbi:MAG: short-chain dehydrogenase [Acidimicrobiaceae bacterium]|jgi:NAD(P)-dependent dehydrogenase (short-subunit alcohol dehydrogenase family)|nr:short-chain dehydrogenase [Acidimicrobiaceae bacterium]|tara:strand:+ start:33852 stop:34685 length:834 start_codon:yes stop_codon:yes gene_type:complete
MRSELENLGVLVTGGGTGIGKACATEMFSRGARVTICGRTEEKLKQSAEEIASSHQSEGDIQYVICDVTDEDQVYETIHNANEFGKGLDGVVANAGGGGAIVPYHMQTAEEFSRVLNLNILGTMLCIKHSVPLLRESTRASFVGMSSIASHITHLWFGAYPAAKAGIEAIIRNAADEYGPANIRFNAVRPGFIETEIMEGIPRDSDIYKSYIDNTPLGDVGSPQDVASLVRFLLTSESRWITGQCINVDGGHSLRRGPQFTQFLGGFSDEQLRGKLP